MKQNRNKLKALYLSKLGKNNYFKQNLIQLMIDIIKELESSAYAGNLA